MIFISKDKATKIYAKVWKVEKREKYTALQVSTVEKQQDGSYKNSGWNCRLVGKAKEFPVNKGDRIIITSAKIENVYNAEQKKSWLNIIVFDLESEASNDNPFESDDDLPF